MIARLAMDIINVIFRRDAYVGNEGFEYLFTDVHEAVRELKRRQADPKLKQDIHSALGSSAGPLLSQFKAPMGLLFRQLVTPTHEILHFLDTVRFAGLQPLVLEYSGDKFVSAGNPYKRALGKLPIYQHTGSDGRDMARNIRVIDFNDFVGKRLSDVCCISGMTLIEFHHMLFSKVTGVSPEDIVFDGTDWFAANGDIARSYYEAYLSLFIRDCILFENFHPTPQEIPFTRDIVAPAFNAIYRRYGLRPLIVRLVPEYEELRPYWDMYPKSVADLMP